MTTNGQTHAEDTGPRDEADPTMKALRDGLAGDLPEDLERRMRRSLDGFRGDLAEHPYVRRTGGEADRRRGGLPALVRWVLRPAVAAGVAVALVLIALHLTAGDVPLTWAAVAKQFRSVQFFSATVYFKDNVLGETRELELWMGQGGRVRIRVGSQVIFGQGGKPTKVFDIKTRQAVEPDRLAARLLEMLGGGPEFSLEVVVQAFSGGEIKDATPLVNADATISEDLVVFDMVAREGAEWGRVWALKQSRLPVRIRVWNPGDGGCVEALFSYTREQPAEFFDPDAYAAILKNSGAGKATLAYAFLKDPGGRDVCPPPPGDLDEQAVWTTVTTTLDGKPWSLADHRGKTVLIHFWNVQSPSQWEDCLKELHQRYGERDDFLIVGVSLLKSRNADLTRQWCDKKQIPWLHLHEPGRGQNSLARAVGGNPMDTLWLASRTGSLWKLKHGAGLMVEMVEAELEGIHFDTFSRIWLLIRPTPETPGKTRDEIRALCRRDPDSIETTEDGTERWHYRLVSEDQMKVWNVTLSLDPAGRAAGWSLRFQYVHPARARITVSEDHWKTSIEPRLDAKTSPRTNDQYGFAYALKGHGASFSVGLGHPWTDVEPGKTYHREMEPGTYGLYLLVCDKRTFSEAQAILLKEGIQMERDKTTDITLE